mmetsp:Transcript_30349/g.92820  ORF Transcript_30349/g.92820 Transcript_30349/m.92820 type:complete len:489 (-) Transcript_30349:119-1585(-)
MQRVRPRLPRRLQGRRRRREPRRRRRPPRPARAPHPRQPRQRQCAPARRPRADVPAEPAPRQGQGRFGPLRRRAGAHPAPQRPAPVSLYDRDRANGRTTIGRRRRRSSSRRVFKVGGAPRGGAARGARGDGDGVGAVAELAAAAVAAVRAADAGDRAGRARRGDSDGGLCGDSEARVPVAAGAAEAGSLELWAPAQGAEALEAAAQSGDAAPRAREGRQGAHAHRDDGRFHGRARAETARSRSGRRRLEASPGRGRRSGSLRRPARRRRAQVLRDGPRQALSGVSRRPVPPPQKGQGLRRRPLRRPRRPRASRDRQLPHQARRRRGQARRAPHLDEHEQAREAHDLRAVLPRHPSQQMRELERRRHPGRGLLELPRPRPRRRLRLQVRLPQVLRVLRQEPQPRPPGHRHVLLRPLLQTQVRLLQGPHRTHQNRRLERHVPRRPPRRPARRRHGHTRLGVASWSFLRCFVLLSFVLPLLGPACRSHSSS